MNRLDKDPSGESTGRYALFTTVRIRSSGEEYASDTEQSVNYATLKDVKALHTLVEFVLDMGPRRNVVVGRDVPINRNGRDCVDFMVHIAERMLLWLWVTHHSGSGSCRRLYYFITIRMQPLLLPSTLESKHCMFHKILLSTKSTELSTQRKLLMTHPLVILHYFDNIFYLLFQFIIARSYVSLFISRLVRKECVHLSHPLSTLLSSLTLTTTSFDIDNNN